MGLQLSGYRLGSDTLTQLYEDIFRFVIILQTILTISWWGEAGLSTIVTTIVTTIVIPQRVPRSFFPRKASDVVRSFLVER